MKGRTYRKCGLFYDETPDGGNGYKMAKRPNQGLHFYDRKKRKIHFTVIREILLYALYGAAAVFLAVFTVRNFGFRIGNIGNSMEPMISAGQSVLVNTLSYRIGSIKQGDVIAFYPGGNTNAHPSVKRVAALSGDSVQIVDGDLLINGIPYTGNDLYPEIADPGIAGRLVILAASQTRKDAAVNACFLIDFNVTKSLFVNKAQDHVAEAFFRIFDNIFQLTPFGVIRRTVAK